MKKQLLLLILVFCFSWTHAQLTPVSNLEFSHWYECPQNYYSLTWSCDAAESDSLIGFNIYRNSDLYLFTTEYSLYNDPYFGEDPNGPETFLNGDDFYIHVTAVYTRDSLESSYTDSVHCVGLYISVNDKMIFKPQLSPNPMNDFVSISNLNASGKSSFLKVYNIIGEEILSTPLSQNKNRIDCSEFESGVYLFQISSGNKMKAIKVLKQ